MLNSLLMINFYSFFQRYWNEKYSLTASNATIGIAQTSLVYISGRIESDDTTANQTLISNEATAQTAYIEAFRGNRAGILSDEQLAAFLLSFESAKAARRTILPNVEPYINSLKSTTQSAMSVEQKQLEDWEISLNTYRRRATEKIPIAEAGIAEAKANILAIQEAIDVIDEFETNINVFVDAMESDLDLIETTGVPPVSYQDIIDASQYTYDGTYSDEVNHISPEGNLYGQTTTVREVEHLYWWAGEEWNRIPDEVDQAASVALLPTDRPFGEIFRVPSTRYNATTSSYEWDYYLSTGDGWELMNEYWEIDGVNNLPALGYKVGDYHKVIERLVTVKWDGYEWNRLSLSSFDDDIGLTTGIADIVATASDLRGDHNELVESFLGEQISTANNFNDIVKFATITDKQLTTNIAKLITDVNAFTVDTAITQTEADNLELDLNLIESESTKVINVATELGVVAEKATYLSALANLQSELEHWIDLPSYPFTWAAQDKSDILFAANELEDRRVDLHAALAEEFDGSIVDYTVEQIVDVNQAIGNVEEDISEFSDDGFITFVEAKALKISFIQLEAESTDIVAIATALEVESGVTWPEKTAYTNALTALETELGDWIDQPEASYPIHVVSNDRTQINDALALVKSTRDTLAKKIRDNDREYVVDQIGDVTEALGDLQDDVLEFSDDGFLTYTESVELQRSLAELNKESLDLIAIATSLGITIEKANYEAALSNLTNSINTWIGLASYPAVITTNQRTDLITRLETTQNTKSLLANEIGRKRQEDVAKYVNNQIADANSSQTALYNDWNDRVSDDSVTSAEAANLRLLIAQYLYEVDALKAIADGVSLTALALTYQNAGIALAAGINSIINTTYVYPLAVTSNQKAAIEALFVTAKSTKKALIDALTATSTYGVGGSGFDVSQFRKVYDGFIRGFTPELRLVYISQNELSLQPNYGDFDYLKVNDQNIEASKRTSVFTFTPVLGWNENAQALYTSTLQADTEYWVYLANRDSRFKDDIPGGVYDYRGRLFCSGTSPSNNYLGEAGLGLHAILIGKAETDNNTKFRHELDVSLVSRQSDLKETFREFSDFDLTYTDEDTLTLERIYGTYGQIYIPESLYYIGENREVYTTSPRIEVDVNENLVYDTSTIDINTLYYVYIAADSDVYNFNEINIVTNLPWHPEDSDPTPSLYDADKDFRLWMFLSTKEPEEGRLAETYQGFWARHIGQVRTDGTGKFIYSGGVSAIRQATLNPTYFDGLAEISILGVTTTTFKIIRKRGTSGIVMVGSKGTLTYDADNPSVHTVTTADTVYTYTEANPSSPLSSTGTILDLYIGREKYVYLANDNDCWGSLKNRTFLCDIEPTDAYLSQNFPGNNARWICTVNLAAGTKGAELITNGNFVNSNDWDGQSGWGWSEANLNAYHNTGNTFSLDQVSMTVVAGGTYEVAVTVSGVGAGSVTPKLGNTLGTAITSAQRSVQYIIATNTDVLKFVPTSTFNGAVDTVTCFKVEHGAFTGSYITDSIAKTIPVFDDTIVSSTAGWTSNKIMQVINDALGVSGTTSVFNAQKTGGLNVRLEYLDTTTVRLIPTSGQDSYIVFPDLSFRTIPAAGITLTVSGSANTRYYVYLTSSSFYMSTTAPDNFYTKLETLGTATIQVGDICMTSTNTMSGAWNVCSSHQEPTREWSYEIDNNNSQVCPSSMILSKRGAISARLTGYLTCYWQFTINIGNSYQQGGSGYVNVNPCDGERNTPWTWLYGYTGYFITVTSLNSNIQEGLGSNITYIDSCQWYSNYSSGSSGGSGNISSRNNQVVLTRSAT